MIYQLHNDISARSDSLPLIETLPCEVGHASCPIMLLLLSIIDIAVAISIQAHIESD
jgi:hypothetical protein